MPRTRALDARRTPFDRLAKDTWSAVLERAGRAETEREIVGDALRIDLTFEPEEGKLDALEPFGLMGRMMAEAGPCLVEFFHAAPSVDDVLDCVQKVLERRRRWRLKSNEAVGKRAKVPRLWIVAAGRPSKALEQLGGGRAREWPVGTYRLAEGFRTHVIVVSELPVERDTLLLRVLGAGAVLKAALVEVGALPSAAPERGILLSAVLRLKRDIQSADPRTPEDEEFLMTTQDMVQQWERELIEQGLQQGLQRGLQQGLQRGRDEGRLAERAEDVIRVLTARKLSVNELDRERVLACKDLERLGRWLERAATVASVAEVFAD